MNETEYVVRTFEAVAVEVEGRTVDVRIVPFGEVARVADPPSWEPYDEEWMPGVFDHQINAANRVHANYEHGADVTNVVGHGISMRAVDGDGYHASFKIHDTNAGSTTLELLRDGALPGVSLEARPIKSVRTATGVVQRVKANLRGIAFCRTPAFTGAQVLAVRNEPEIVVDEALLPVDMDDQLVERCRRLGIRLPQRYEEAHPDIPDTPADAGTSDGSAPATPDNQEHSEV